MKRFPAVLIVLLTAASALVPMMVSRAGDAAGGSDPAAGGSPPFAMHQHGRHGMGPMGFMLRKLNLSDDQRQQVRTIFETSRQDSAPLRMQLRQVHNQISGSIAASGYQEDQVRALVQANSGLLVDLAVQHFATMAKVRAVLNPAQLKQLDDMRSTATPDGESIGGPGSGM